MTFPNGKPMLLYFIKAKYGLLAVGAGWPCWTMCGHWRLDQGEMGWWGWQGKGGCTGRRWRCLDGNLPYCDTYLGTWECFLSPSLADKLINWKDTLIWSIVEQQLPTHCRLTQYATQVGSYIFIVGGHNTSEYCSDLLPFILVSLCDAPSWGNAWCLWIPCDDSCK